MSRRGSILAGIVIGLVSVAALSKGAVVEEDNFNLSLEQTAVKNVFSRNSDGMEGFTAIVPRPKTVQRLGGVFDLSGAVHVQTLGGDEAFELGKRSPNFVMIYLDDSGYGDYSHNGNPTISTPNITRLTQDGVSFSQFYVSAAACTASRYSLLTGRYPGRSGLGQWVVGPATRRHIHREEFTIAEGLKTKGYATGIFGKWHLGTPNKHNAYSAETLPLAHGFDTWIGTDVSHDFAVARLMKSNDSGDGYEVLATDLPSHPEVCESLTELCTAAAVEFIEQNKAKPFFAYIPYNMPHLGLYASDAYKGTSRRGLLGDVMAEVDDSIGKIRDALREAGVEDNTLIIFASDNGPWIRFRGIAHENNKYGESRLHVGYAMPFRDGKGSTWEGGHRVPGIFCWPDTIPGNRVDRNPISQMDILPTVFALAGVKLPRDRTIDGRDIRSLLLPGIGLPKTDPFCFLYSYSDNKPSAIRKGPWKLHVRIGSQTGDDYGFTASREKPLLFQVEQDLGERIDRAAEKPEIVEDLLTELKTFEAQIEAEGSFWDAK